MTTPPEPTEPPTAFDENGSSDGTVFEFTTLQQNDRKDLVGNTSFYSAAAFIQANRLELTALGANAELHGFWAQNTSSNLASWSDIGVGGRTLHSQLTRRGYLFPLGHKATITTIFERVIAVDPSGPVINHSNDPGNFPVAYLQSQTFIRVVEQVKSYPALGQPFGFTVPSTPPVSATTDWPFTSVRMVTTTTPSLLPPQDSPVFGQDFGGQAFWPQVQVSTNSGQDIMWSFVATDLAGNDVPFSMPLVFFFGLDDSFPGYSSEYAPLTGLILASRYQEMQQNYTNPSPPAGTPAPHQYWSTTQGSPLQFTPGPSGPAQVPYGGSTHPALLVALGASSISFDPNSAPSSFSSPVTQAQLTAAGQPNFYPTIATARIRLHSAEALTGSGFGDTPLPANAHLNIVGPSIQFDYYDAYVAGGTSDGSPNNAGSIYAAATNVTMSTPAVTKPPTPAVPLGVPLNMPANTVGGIGTPNLGITGLSAVKGAIGGTLATFATQNGADLSEYFPSEAALGTQAQNTASQAISQLLGGLNLGDILAGNGFANSTPSITSQTNPATGGHMVTYSMVAPLAQWPTADNPSTVIYPIFVPDSATGMMTLNTTVSSMGGQAPQVTTSGSIDPFAIWLLGNEGSLSFFMLHFESFTFTAGNGGKPSVNVNLDQTKFEGCLSFINMLSEFLQSLGGSGLSVDVEALSVAVSITIALPDLGMGMFSLTGLSLVGGVKIPFIDGVSTATFSFCSQANPFTLTVCCFGGGGWVALAVGFGGIQSVQATFEFTGQLALDVVVASGSVSLSAGIYFGYFDPPALGPNGFSGVTLTGFVHINGQVQILGIITVTATLVLSISYMSEDGSVSGTASVSIGVSICGFSKTISFSVTKTFAGSSSSNGAIAEARREAPKSLNSVYRPPVLVWSDLIDQTDFATYCNAFSV